MSREKKPIGREPVASDRGIYEEEIAPEGQRWFKVVTSAGNVGIVHMPVELIDAGWLRRLWDQLETQDPVAEKGRRGSLALVE